MFVSRSTLFTALVAGVALLAAPSPTLADNNDLNPYNHKAPTRYPAWFLPQADLGVTTWLNAEDTPATETMPADHSYIFRSHFASDEVINRVLALLKSRHFGKIDFEAGKKITALEFDPDTVEGAQAAAKAGHNYFVDIEADVEMDQDAFRLQIQDGSVN